MAWAATPIRAIDSSRPNTRTAGCSRAAPATASTLSSDMETSAIRIWIRASRKVFGLTLGSVGRVDVHGGLGGLVLGAAAWSRSSRHIFQQTQSSSRPPANSRPTIAEQLGGDQREADAHDHRGGQAPEDRLLALLRRQAAGRQADGDGVVAGQHQVDHQDLEEGGEGGRG